MEGIALTNQERIRISGEKEIYKYLGKSEANMIKQRDKRKSKKGEVKKKQENFLKPTRKGTLLFKILWILSKMDCGKKSSR